MTESACLKSRRAIKIRAAERQNAAPLALEAAYPSYSASKNWRSASAIAKRRGSRKSKGVPEIVQPPLVTYLTNNVSFLIAPMLDALSVSILETTAASTWRLEIVDGVFLLTNAALRHLQQRRLLILLLVLVIGSRSRIGGPRRGGRRFI